MRPTNTLVLMIVFLVVLAGQSVVGEEIHEAEYINAVADYYEVSLDAVQTAVDAGIPAEELPVLLFIADRSNATSAELTTSRIQGKTWQQIAAAQNVTAADFYVSYSDKIRSSVYRSIYAKFTGLKRNEFAQVQLSDDDIVNLSNLRFLYKHYNYSQRIIMNWAGEGKGFAQINQMTYVVTTEMKTQHLADNE